MDAITKLEALLDELPNMEKARMVELWEQYFGSRPSPKLQRGLMRPILAFRIQERHYGPPAPDVQQRLQEAMKTYSPTGKIEPVGRYKNGTRIVREWGGELHEVHVNDEGYLYRGEVYRSLSPIANRITGTRWSGPSFFGTKPKAGKK